jgi:hypothetical protein
MDETLDQQMWMSAYLILVRTVQKYATPEEFRAINAEHKKNPTHVSMRSYRAGERWAPSNGSQTDDAGQALNLA